MVWSFSRLNTYHACPKMFKKQYLDHYEPQVQNAFAQWGSLCHHCLERFFKGELFVFELLDEYRDKYDEYVTERFPPNAYKDLNESYRASGENYFSNIQNLPEHLEVLGVEQKFQTEFGGYPFIGYIDLILRDKRDGGIIIEDHKSKAMFKDAAEQEHYAIQMYLYSKYIFDTYQIWPKLLVFNMFRAGQTVEIPFVPEDYDKAFWWMLDTIRAIYKDERFLDKIKIEYARKGKKLRDYKYADFFCSWLCNVRFDCLRSKLKKGRGK